MDLVKQQLIFHEIHKERRRQERVHPETENFSEVDMFKVLVQEVLEVSDAIKKGDHENKVEELVQVASFCCRWLERNDWN